jgi:hypothetical protein
MANETKNWVNSLYVKRKWSDGSGKELISVGVKKKDFLLFLQKVEENKNGFVNITLGTQTNDVDKFSAWLDDKGQNGSNSTSTNTSQSTPTQTSNSSQPSNDNDDLPF